MICASVSSDLNDDTPFPGRILIQPELGEIISCGQEVEDVFVVQLEEGNPDTELCILLHPQLVKELS